MTIALGADHAGFEYKNRLAEFLVARGYLVQDCGTFSAESADYPDFAVKAARAVGEAKADFAIVVCGSGVGVSIVANKVRGVRCALCFNEEMAALARRHNNANALALGARFLTPEAAETIAQTFLSTEFEGGRHERRVEKIGILTEL